MYIDDPVQRIMSKKLITVKMGDSLRKAYQMMQECRIRHLPVTDETGAIIGILSDRDVQRAMKPCKNELDGNDPQIEFDPKFTAADFMSWPIRSVPTHTSILELVVRMLDEKVSAFVVMDEHHYPKGIVTTDDLLKFLLKSLEKNPVQAKIDSILSTFMSGNYSIGR